MTGGIRGRLLNDNSGSYGPSHQEHLFRQYLHYVESAEKISERRVAANNYLLTINSILVALYGTFPAAHAAGFWSLLLPFAGVLMAATWLQIVTSYRDLNSIKYSVIHELEAQLPAALYAYEWYKADMGRGDAYRPTSHLERAVPVIFGLIYIGLGVAHFVST